MEKDLNELVERLKKAAGANLTSVVLYGSAAAGEFHPKHSDLNVLCVLGRLGAAELEKLNSATAWWARKGHPAPVVFTLEELRSSADVFAIELLDIKAQRRVLHGEDTFAELEVPMTLHRQQVERELRSRLVRLRQVFLAAPQNKRVLLGFMTASVSTFGVLFRHALIALGAPAPGGKRAAVDQLSQLLGFDPSGFHALFDLREGKRKEGDLDVMATFASYLAAVTRVAEEVDRRLAVGR